MLFWHTLQTCDNHDFVENLQGVETCVGIRAWPLDGSHVSLGLIPEPQGFCTWGSQLLPPGIWIPQLLSIS